MYNFIWISLGAIIGANMRYLISRTSFLYLSPSIPYGTLIVNVTGSFIVGLFLHGLPSALMLTQDGNFLSLSDFVERIPLIQAIALKLLH